MDGNGRTCNRQGMIRAKIDRAVSVILLVFSPLLTRTSFRPYSNAPKISYARANVRRNAWDHRQVEWEAAPAVVLGWPVAEDLEGRGGK